jgi:hypothetical protein
MKIPPCDYSGSPASTTASLYRSCRSELAPVGSLSSLRRPPSSSAWSQRRWCTPGRGLTDRTPSSTHIMSNSAESIANAMTRAAICRSAWGRPRNHRESWSRSASGSRPGGSRRVSSVPRSAGLRTEETIRETNRRASSRSSASSRSVTRSTPLCQVSAWPILPSSGGDAAKPRYGTEMARRPGSAALAIRQAGRRTQPDLLVWGGAPAGIEPATPSLPFVPSRFYGEPGAGQHDPSDRKHRQEPPASGRYGIEMARSCLPSCRQLGGQGRDPGQRRPQAVAERCERSEHPCRGVAEDALQLGTATPMQASRGTGGYLSVWSSISALGRLRLTTQCR